MRDLALQKRLRKKSSAKDRPLHRILRHRRLLWDLPVKQRLLQAVILQDHFKNSFLEHPIAQDRPLSKKQRWVKASPGKNQPGKDPLRKDRPRKKKRLR